MIAIYHIQFQSTTPQKKRNKSEKKHRNTMVFPSIFLGFPHDFAMFPWFSQTSLRPRRHHGGSRDVGAPGKLFARSDAGQLVPLLRDAPCGSTHGKWVINFRRTESFMGFKWRLLELFDADEIDLGLFVVIFNLKCQWKWGLIDDLGGI